MASIDAHSEKGDEVKRSETDSGSEEQNTSKEQSQEIIREQERTIRGFKVGHFDAGPYYI